VLRAAITLGAISGAYPNPRLSGQEIHWFDTLVRASCSIGPMMNHDAQLKRSMRYE
jgi:hypothetical protein